MIGMLTGLERRVRRVALKAASKKKSNRESNSCPSCSKPCDIPWVVDLLRVLATAGGVVCSRLVAGPVVAAEELEISPWLNTVLFSGT